MMSKMKATHVANGIWWVEIPAAELYVLCGCPADSVKHLMRRGLITETETKGVTYETGPNAILLSDVLIQNGSFANLAEFPVLQMLYRQGLILPDHPNNTGMLPLLIGSEEQVKAQQEYIYRGNYGLISAEEIEATGIDPDTARDMMRLKLKFAFGNIRPTKELLERRIVGHEPIEIRNSVTIRRLSINRFEFRYEDETVPVDLNLKPHTTYGVPYNLGFQQVNREYFAVIHSGNGDGWDIHRPSMASIVLFQGKIYLVDAGPNVDHTLQALGIGVNEIEGLFHTHAHDDHFCGLTTLTNADHKIKYYATPVVRASVQKKWAALTAIAEEEFYQFFDVHDMDVEIWNDVEALEVKPIMSPHPVETNILLFRAPGPDGYHTYAHWADIASLAVLQQMITDDDSGIGISQDYFNQVKDKYFTPVDLKKIDIGGGLIHGDAEDFREDHSKKIILSHTSLPLTDKQKEIGSGAPFGMVDRLITSHHDYARHLAADYLKAYFSAAPDHQIEILLNNRLETYNPESILLKKGYSPDDIHLVLTGTVEMIRSELGVRNILSAGALIGEIAALMDTAASETYRAEGFVRVLAMPTPIYIDFVKRNGFLTEIEQLHEIRQFLQCTSLFGEAISYTLQNRLAQQMTLRQLPSGHLFTSDDSPGIWIICSGQVRRFIHEDTFETLGRGDFFFEETVLSGMPSLFTYEAVEPVRAYLLPADAVTDIPIVRWKLFEAYKKRMRSLLDPGLVARPVFGWSDEYSVHIAEFDEQHKKLFETATKLNQALDTTAEKGVLEETLEFLIDHARFHFEAEEKVMEQYDFPGLESHKKEHQSLIEDVLNLQDQFRKDEIQIDRNVVNFLKDWIIDHILTTDRKYTAFLKARGVT